MGGTYCGFLSCLRFLILAMGIRLYIEDILAEAPHGEQVFAVPVENVVGNGMCIEKGKDGFRGHLLDEKFRTEYVNQLFTQILFLPIDAVDKPRFRIIKILCVEGQ